MFTFDLAEIMKPKGVSVNCLDPGTVNTKMLLAGKQKCCPPDADHQVLSIRLSKLKLTYYLWQLPCRVMTACCLMCATCPFLQVVTVTVTALY